MSIVAARRGGEGLRGDDGHDAACCFRPRPLSRYLRFCRAETQFWPDLLKEGFNFSDLPRMVSAP
jgi:hypothetical protein